MAKSVYLDPVSGEPQDQGGVVAPTANFVPQSTADPGDPASDPSTPGPQGPPPPPGPPPTPNPQPAPPAGAPPGPPPAPAAPTTPAGLSGNPNYFDGTDKGILDFVTDAGINVPQMNESVRRDPAYWTRRIKETGGLRQDNYAFWWGLMLTPEGGRTDNPPAAPPSPPGGGTSTNPGLDPSISAFFNAQTANLAQQQQRDAEIRAIIRTRLAAAQQPVDENSAEITQPLSAARDEVTRSQDTERTALAERLYAQGGLNTGALGQQIQQSAERNGLGLANVRAGLISHVADAKRQELQALLQMATAQGDSASARAISAQIAALNASVTSQGQGIGLAEFLAQLNQNAALAGLRG